jgi:hypothetical protein
MPLTTDVTEKLQSVTDKPSGQKGPLLNRNKNQRTKKIAVKVGWTKFATPTNRNKISKAPVCCEVDTTLRQTFLLPHRRRKGVFL